MKASNCRAWWHGGARGGGTVHCCVSLAQPFFPSFLPAASWVRLRAPPPPGRSRTCLRCSGQPPGACPVLPGRLIRPGSLLRCPLQARGDGGSACPSGACAPKLAAFPRLNGCPYGLTQTSPGCPVSWSLGSTQPARGAGQRGKGKLGTGERLGVELLSCCVVSGTTQCLSALQ